MRLTSIASRILRCGGSAIHVFHKRSATSASAVPPNAAVMNASPSSTRSNSEPNSAERSGHAIPSSQPTSKSAPKLLGLAGVRFGDRLDEARLELLRIENQLAFVRREHGRAVDPKFTCVLDVDDEVVASNRTNCADFFDALPDEHLVADGDVERVSRHAQVSTRNAGFASQLPSALIRFVRARISNLGTW